MNIVAFQILGGLGHSAGGNANFCLEGLYSARGTYAAQSAGVFQKPKVKLFSSYNVQKTFFCVWFSFVCFVSVEYTISLFPFFTSLFFI